MILVNDKLGIQVPPSRGRSITDLTLFRDGFYWIQSPVMKDLEEALGENINLSEKARELYEKICTVRVFYRSGLYYIQFHKYPMRPWCLRDSHDYDAWFSMVDAHGSSKPLYTTPHRFMVISAIRWLEKFGYTIEVSSPEWIYPQNKDQVTVSFGEPSVTLRDHQKESVKRAEERQNRIVIGDSPGLGKCLKEDTLVILGDGTVKEIKEIYDEYKDVLVSVDDSEEIINLHNIRVISFDGKKMITTEAKHLYRQKINDPLITVKTASGKKITSTLNHKFYVFDHHGCGVWKKSTDLTMDDYIAIPKERLK